MDDLDYETPGKPYQYLSTTQMELYEKVPQST